MAVAESCVGGVIDLTPFVEEADRDALSVELTAQLCKKGYAVVRHPSCTAEKSRNILSLMQSYLQQDQGTKMLDVRSETTFSVGLTPEHTETQFCAFDDECKDVIKSLESTP